MDLISVIEILVVLLILDVMKSIKSLFSVAIIRDKIANLNIDTILKNRNQLRDSIRDEI